MSPCKRWQQSAPLFLLEFFYLDILNCSDMTDNVNFAISLTSIVSDKARFCS